MKKVILNVDTGIDDLTAIIFACCTKNLDVAAIITTAGNISLKQVTKNTLGVLSFIGKNEIPVFSYKCKPYSKEKFIIKGVHGKDGVGGFKFPKPNMKAQKGKNLPAFLAKLSEVIIISTAPLTPIADLITKHPQIKTKIKKIVVQSGLLTDETYTSFNVKSDPESAKIVLTSGIEIEICPSDMGHMAFLNKNDVNIISQIGKVGEMLEFCFRSYRDRSVKNNVATHDGCAVASVAYPKIFIKEKAWVEVNDIGTLHFNFKSKTPNSLVCTKIDVEKFKKLLISSIKKLAK